MSIIISIDGNIGSGKSTMVNILKDQFLNNDNIIFLEEPVSEWIKIKDDNKNILEKFYEDPIKYSFPFQMMALITRYTMLKETIKKHPDSIIITERSLYTDKYIFAKMLHDSKKMNTYEYQIYDKWFNEFSKKIPHHKHIYIVTNPNTCIDRIHKRNRDGEDNIDIDYLLLCHDYHNEMFKILNPDLVVNVNDCELNSREYNYLVNEVREYIITYSNISNIKYDKLLLFAFVVGLIYLILFSYVFYSVNKNL